MQNGSFHELFHDVASARTVYRYIHTKTTLQLLSWVQTNNILQIVCKETAPKEYINILVGGFDPSEKY